MQHLVLKVASEDHYEDATSAPQDNLHGFDKLLKPVHTISRLYNFTTSVFSCANENANRYFVDCMEQWISEHNHWVSFIYTQASNRLTLL